MIRKFNYSNIQYLFEMSSTSSLEGGYPNPTSAVVIDRVNILVRAAYLYGVGPLGIRSPMGMIW